MNKVISLLTSLVIALVSVSALARLGAVDDHKNTVTGNANATGVTCSTGNCAKNTSSVTLGANTNPSKENADILEEGKADKSGE